MEYIVFRLLTAFLCGVILSQCGTLIQLNTKNILASPSTLGFDGLSIFWILLCHSLFLFSGQDIGPLFLYLSGLPFFLGISFLFLWMTGRAHNIEKLILIGLTFNLLVGAVFSLWQFLFLAFNLPFPVELWFGHFRYAAPKYLLVLVFVEFFILLGWFYLKKTIDIFSLGPAVMRNFKLNFKLLNFFILSVVALGTFTVVSLFGAFSFLGLIFPIIARKMWFRKFDLSGEFLIGGPVNGVVLMLIDSVCYYFPVYGAEVPVGLIATAVGALSLIALLWKSDGRLEIVAKTQK